MTLSSGDPTFRRSDWYRNSRLSSLMALQSSITCLDYGFNSISPPPMSLARERLACTVGLRLARVGWLRYGGMLLTLLTHCLDDCMS